MGNAHAEIPLILMSEVFLSINKPGQFYLDATVNKFIRLLDYVIL